MLSKKIKARRRACKTRIRIRASGKLRLCVRHSLKHTYAQVIATQLTGDQVLVAASTLDAEVKAAGALSNNIKAAGIIGSIIAKRALSKEIRQVAFDRSGHRYHGRIKKLAEAARAEGLEF